MTTLIDDKFWEVPGAVFEKLRGSWLISRDIPGEGSFEGMAVFAPKDGHLKYEEEGTLRLNAGNRFSSTRSYLFGPAPMGFVVFFDEVPPRLFHEVELSHEGDFLFATATHRCAPDLYTTEYSFAPDGTFRIVHDVHGPRKNYVMETRYQRI